MKNIRTSGDSVYLLYFYKWFHYQNFKSGEILNKSWNVLALHTLSLFLKLWTQRIGPLRSCSSILVGYKWLERCYDNQVTKPISG